MLHSLGRYIVFWQRVCNSFVTVVRQSTAVPKTSKKSAFTPARRALLVVGLLLEPCEKERSRDASVMLAARLRKELDCDCVLLHEETRCRTQADCAYESVNDVLILGSVISQVQTLAAQCSCSSTGLGVVAGLIRRVESPWNRKLDQMTLVKVRMVQ